MNKLLVALCALACGANALYHFHLNLPDPCDLIVNQTAVTDPYSTMVMKSRVHGTFEYTETTAYQGGMEIYKSTQLIRPDQAEPDKAAAVYVSDPDECEAYQADESGTISQIVDLYFTDREENVMFHGIKCTALYNSSDPDVTKYMVNEQAGLMYGMVSDDVDITMDITATKNNRREMFKFDKSEQPRCESASYILPTPAAYDAGCKKTVLPNLLRMARHVRRH